MMARESNLQNTIPKEMNTFNSSIDTIKKFARIGIDIILMSIDSYRTFLFDKTYRKRLWTAYLLLFIYWPLVIITIWIPRDLTFFIMELFGITSPRTGLVFHFWIFVYAVISTMISFSILIDVIKEMIYEGNRDIPSSRTSHKLVKGFELSFILLFVIFLSSAFALLLFGSQLSLVESLFLSVGQKNAIEISDLDVAWMFSYFLVPFIIIKYITLENPSEILRIGKNSDFIKSRIYRRISIATIIAGPLTMFVLHPLMVYLGFSKDSLDLLSVVLVPFFLIMVPFLVIGTNISYKIDLRDGRKCFCDFTTQTKFK